MSQTCSIGEKSGDLVGQGKVLTARKQSKDMRVSDLDSWPWPLQTLRRWPSASRVKQDSSFSTMRCQSDGNHDDWLRHHSKRFHRCCGIKGRRLKGHCERNPASATRTVMVEDTTGGESVHFILKFFTASIDASTSAQLSLYVPGDDLLLRMTTHLQTFRQCDHVPSHSIALKYLRKRLDGIFRFFLSRESQQ
ncbi:hypothetical protein TNCV_1808761 [Trichonephila clavipes]|nr:hypothetical protein TNCV_1808761 [Trichonephila clavipes]